MLGVANYQFPFPARAGKQRHVSTVDQSTWQGWAYRPTINQAQSLLRTTAYAKNNWFGSPYASQMSEKQMRAESRAKAAKIGGNEHYSFTPIVDILKETAQTASEFKSIADQLFYDWNLTTQSINPGSTVPGTTPGVTEINYTSRPREEAIEQKMSIVDSTLDTFLGQIKGLFNIAYPTNVVTTPAVAEAETKPAISVWIILALIALLVIGK